MSKRTFKPGDLVIYRKTKHSTHPGPRAEDVHPAAGGDDYTYRVDKFWVVVETREDGKVLLRTRGGKEHLIDADDPKLRHASWWERIFYRDKFPPLAPNRTAS